MSYKKRAFTLIEVVIAILLATGACLFLLQFESTLLSRSHHSLKKLEIEQVKQQSCALLFEQLYSNQIPWKSILEGKSYSIELPPSAWIAEWCFQPKRFPEMIDPNMVDVEVELQLHRDNETIEKAANLRLFLKKELGSDETT